MSKSRINTIFFIISLVCVVVCMKCQASVNTIEIDVCFTPQDDCTQKIVTKIANAKAQILVQAYSFTSYPIIAALVSAHKRGVDVDILLDKSNRKSKKLIPQYLVHNGVNVKIDYKPAIAHNKVMIIDKQTVVTGSFNFTSAAQRRNAENMIFIKDFRLAEKYIINWNYRNSLSSNINYK